MSAINSFHVGTIEEIHKAGRKRVVIQDRDIFVLSHRGKFYALDSFCYHAGGPLHEGDIEAVDPFNQKKPPEVKSKGVKQRTHTVTIENDNVYVTLSSLENRVESDHYNCTDKGRKFHCK
ncbi:Rieske domain-containing protein-like isoform X2 [Pomacea canaliculata]|uniref:Rieske domain-containing protein-like isoform X2 n=1 Tax=Pomacea canaliculata TaxID=400727 RepID=UPI000D73F72E|nr:Rieske domain-containing protein-like isoform X2 [Pomacea canaliculata]